MRQNTARSVAWESSSKLRALLDLMLANVANQGDQPGLLLAAATCATPVYRSLCSGFVVPRRQTIRVASRMRNRAPTRVTQIVKW